MIDERELPSGWVLLPMRRAIRKLSRPIRPTDEVVTAYRNGRVALRSQERADGYTVSLAEAGYQGVDHGDLVFHALDGFAGAVGVSSARGKCTPVYHVCEAVDGNDVRFVAHVLRAMSFSGYLEANASSVRQRSVDFRTWDAFGRLTVPLPPPHEQAAIVESLDAALVGLEVLESARERQLPLLAERRASKIDSVILGARGVPRPIAALADYINGYPFKPDDFTPDGLPVVRIAQLNDPSAPVDRYSGRVPRRNRLNDGDLVFSWSGSLSVAIWNRGEAILNQHLFRVLPRPGIDVFWLRYALETAARLLREHMHGSAMTHITLPMMKLVSIPVPTIAEQLVIGRELAAMDGAVAELQGTVGRQRAVLDEHRRCLVSVAVTRGADALKGVA